MIAVIDTGVLFDHPDLKRAHLGGRILPGYDFIANAAAANEAAAATRTRRTRATGSRNRNRTRANSLAAT